IGAQDAVDATLQTSGDATTRTSIALANFRNRLSGLGGGAADKYRAALAEVHGKLTRLRKDAQQHASTVRSVATAKQANQIFDRYTALIEQLLSVNEKAAGSINDAQLHQGADLLNAIARQNEIEKELAVKAVLASVSHDARGASEVQRL